MKITNGNSTIAIMLSDKETNLQVIDQQLSWLITSMKKGEENKETWIHIELVYYLP